MADTPQQAAVRRQLAARGNKIAPRVGEAPAGRAAVKVVQHHEVRKRPREPEQQPGTMYRIRDKDARHRGSSSSRSSLKVPKAPAIKFSFSQHALAGEFLVVVVIIALRAVSDYMPDKDTSKPGKEQPVKGMAPLPLFGVNCASFFLLSLLHGSSKLGSRLAPVIGLLWIMVLAMNSPEIEDVSTWLKNLQASASAGKGGTASGTAATAATAGSGSSGGTAGGTAGTPGGGSATGNAFGAFERAEQAAQHGGALSAVYNGAIKGSGDLIIAAVDGIKGLF